MERRERFEDGEAKEKPGRHTERHSTESACGGGGLGQVHGPRSKSLGRRRDGLRPSPPSPRTASLFMADMCWIISRQSVESDWGSSCPEELPIASLLPEGCSGHAAVLHASARREQCGGCTTLYRLYVRMRICQTSCRWRVLTVGRGELNGLPQVALWQDLEA